MTPSLHKVMISLGHSERIRSGSFTDKVTGEYLVTQLLVDCVVMLFWFCTCVVEDYKPNCIPEISHSVPQEFLYLKTWSWTEMDSDFSQIEDGHLCEWGSRISEWHWYSHWPKEPFPNLVCISAAAEESKHAANGLTCRARSALFAGCAKNKDSPLFTFNL